MPQGELIAKTARLGHDADVARVTGGECPRHARLYFAAHVQRVDAEDLEHGASGRASGEYEAIGIGGRGLYGGPK